MRITFNKILRIRSQHQYQIVTNIPPYNSHLLLVQLTIDPQRHQITLKSQINKTQSHKVPTQTKLNNYTVTEIQQTKHISHHRFNNHQIPNFPNLHQQKKHHHKPTFKNQ